MQIKVVYIYVVPCGCLEFACSTIKKLAKIELFDPGVESILRNIQQSVPSTPLLTIS